MAQSMSGRRIHGGRWFGLFMIAVVVLLVLLLLYLKNHTSTSPSPTRPPGVFGLLSVDQMLQS